MNFTMPRVAYMSQIAGNTKYFMLFLATDMKKHIHSLKLIILHQNDIIKNYKTPFVWVWSMGVVGVPYYP